jgi:hypothetical protein
MECHLQTVNDELGTHVPRHCPTHHSPTEDVEHDRKKEEAGLRRHVRDIGDPQLSRRGCCEFAIDQIGSGPASLSRIVVLKPLRRVAPWILRSRMSLATRLSLAKMFSSGRSA